MKKLKELDDVNVSKNSKLDFYIDDEYIDINIVEWNKDGTNMIMDEMLYSGAYTKVNEKQAREILEKLEQDILEYLLESM